MNALTVKPFTASWDQRINDALSPAYKRWTIWQWMRRNTVDTVCTCENNGDYCDVCLANFESNCSTHAHSAINGACEL